MSGVMALAPTNLKKIDRVPLIKIRLIDVPLG